MEHYPRNIIRMAIILFAFAGVSLAQNSDVPKPAASPSEVSIVTAYCRELATYVKRNPTQTRFFGDVAAYDQSGVTLSAPSTAKWREFKSQEAREATTTPDNLYDTANVWLRGGKIVIAQFEYGSPSGDWAQFVGYCFREDGSLAKLENSFRTFNSDVRIEKERIYDAKGKRLRSSLRCFDLQSGRRKRCEGNYSNYDADVFRTVKQLPFYGLIQSQGTKK